jgi:phosphoglycerol transferase MdoB-like AlkP superfamily enzyme
MSKPPLTLNVLPLLGILFVALKLTNVIDWSWWWVTSPFWGGPAIILAVLILIIPAAVISVFFADQRTLR